MNKSQKTDLIHPRQKFNILPGLLEVSTEHETRFLEIIFENYSLKNIHFRLIPVYTLYMLLRHRLSPFGKANQSAIQKQEDVLALLYRIENLIDRKIEECQKHVGYLSYWLANTSELVHFLKQDRELSQISTDIQFRLIKHLHQLFSYLLNLLQNELDKHLIVFINTRDIFYTTDSLQSTEIRWITSNDHHHPDILSLLSSIVDLFRKCRVNPGLTIEIFSQLFHYINTWLFNRIVGYPELKLCSRFWGDKISLRLKSIQNWAFQQGLELPSEYHLMKTNQLCSLLQSEKRDLYDVQQLVSNKSFQINSIQINEILKNYILDKNEPPIARNFSQA
jgi:afadin